MPLQDFQKRWVVQQSGYNPDEFTVDDNNFIVPIQQPVASQPSIGDNDFPHPKVTTQPPSTGGAFEAGARTFLHEAPAAAGAGAAFMGAFTPTTGAVTAATANPLIGAGAGILAGGGAALLAHLGIRKGQQALEERFAPEYLANLQQLQAEHPTAATIGGIATMPLSGVNPNPLNVVRAARTIPKLLTRGGLPATTAEIQNLANVGVGAGLAVPQDVASRLVEGQPLPTIPEALQTVALGALFNDPNAIGRMMGMHPAAVARELPSINELTDLPVAEAAPTVQTMPLGDVMQTGGAGLMRGKVVRQRAGKEPAIKVPAEATRRYRGEFEPTPEELARLEGEGGVVIEQPVTTEPPARTGLYEPAKRPIALPEHMPTEPIPPERALVLTEPEKFRQPAKQPHRLFSDEPEPPTSEEPPKTQKGPYPRTQFEQEHLAALSDKAIPPDLTPEGYNMFAAFARKMRNTLMKLGTVKNEEGELMAGVTHVPEDLSTTLVEVSNNPSRLATPRTPAHELIGHAFGNMLRKSPRPRDQALMKGYDAAVEKSPEFKQYNEERIASGRKAVTPEEFQATEAGAEYWHRALNLTGESEFKTWYKDFASYLKTRFSPDNALPSDYRRLLNYRFKNDPAFDRYFKTGKIGTSAPTSARSSDEEPTPGTAQSISRYGRQIDAAKSVIAVVEGRKPLTSVSHDAVDFALEAKKNNPELGLYQYYHKGKPIFAFLGKDQQYVDAAVARIRNEKDAAKIGKEYGFSEKEIYDFVNRKTPTFSDEGVPSFRYSDEEPQFDTGKKSWLSPGGEERKVRMYHMDDAANYLRDNRIATKDSSARAIYDAMYERQWARVNETDRAIFVQTGEGRDLTASQLRKLRDQAIESNKMLIKESYGERAKIVYNPGDVFSDEPSKQAIPKETLAEKTEQSDKEMLGAEEEVGKSRQVAVPSNKQQYDKLQAQMKETQFGSDEFQKLWQESEKIKNKYKGQVPPEEQYSDEPSEFEGNKFESDMEQAEAEIARDNKLQHIFEQLEAAKTPEEMKKISGLTDEMLARLRKNLPEFSDEPSDVGDPAKQARIVRNFNTIIRDMRTRGYRPADITTEEKGYVVAYTDHGDHWYVFRDYPKGKEIRLGVNEVFVPGTLKEASFIADNLPSHNKILNAFSRQIVDEVTGKPSERYKQELPDITEETSKLLDKVSEPQLTYAQKSKLNDLNRMLSSWKKNKQQLIDNALEGGYDVGKERIEHYDKNIAKLEKQIATVKSKAERFSDEPSGGDIEYGEMRNRSIERMLKLIDTGIYRGKDLSIISRELVQNARDAFHGYNPISKKLTEVVDEDSSFYALRDNGKGMDATIVLTKYLPPITSGKGVGEGGGFGIAKGIVLGRPENWKMITVAKDSQDGKKYQIRVEGSGEGWKQYASDFLKGTLPAEAKNRNFRRILFNENLEAFREEVPKDTPVGTTYMLLDDSLQFNINPDQYKVLHKSFDTETVKVSNGRELFQNPSQFNAEIDTMPDYKRRQHVKPFTKVYDTVEKPEYDIELLYNPDGAVEEASQIRMHVSSNGSHQFSRDISVGRWGQTAVLPKEMVMNIIPKVKAEHKDYPFNINRDDVKYEVTDAMQSVFKDAIKKAKEKIKNQYARVFEKIIKTKGGIKVANFFKEIDSKFIHEVEANAPVINAFGQAMHDMFPEINGLLIEAYKEAEQIKSKYDLITGTESLESIEKAQPGGLTTRNDIFGVNAYDPSTKVYEAFVNPFTIGDVTYQLHKANIAADITKETPASLAARFLVDTISHEITHNVVRDEGQLLSRAFTFMKSREADVLYKHYTRLVEQLNKEKDLLGQFKYLSEKKQQINSYDKQTEVRVFDSGKERESWDKPTKILSQKVQPLGERRATSAAGEEAEQGNKPQFSDEPAGRGDVDNAKSEAQKLARSKGLYLDFIERDNGKVSAFVSDENGDLVTKIPKDLQSKLDDINRSYLKQNSDEPGGKGNVRFSDEPYKYERQSFAPFLTSRIDKIEEKHRNPTGRLATQALHKFNEYADQLTGQIGNKLISHTQSYPPHQIDRVYRHLHQMDDKGSSTITLNPREQVLAKQIIETLREPRRLQQKEGLLVKAGGSMRMAGIKPEGYMFNMLDPKVAYTWAEKPDSPEAAVYDRQYLKHLASHGVDAKESADILANYKEALGNHVSNDIEFGAIRRAEGKGLPWELVDKNFASAALRYGRRAARDISYFKYLQNDSRVAKALNLKDQMGQFVPREQHPEIKSLATTREVQQAMRSVYGIDMPQNPRVMAASRVASNVVMGVGTAARNILNMPAFVSNYVQTPQLPLAAKALAKLNDTRVKAFQNNAIKANFNEFDAAGFYEGNPNPVINLANRLSAFLRKYQGRDLSDRFEGAYYYSLGELLAVDNIARAKQGNKESMLWVDKFSKTVDGGKEKLLKGEVTQEDVAKMAKSFVNSARGTYSESGLPSWAIEGEFAPFAALSRFAIEKSNTIWKDVILPAKRGIYGPLIRYTLGSLGVGALIEMLNEELTNKRGVEPKINEILAAGKEEELVPKAISLLQLASFAGSVSDAAKLATNMYKGKSIKYNNPLSFPLYTLATDTLAGNISDAAQALKDGDDPFEVMASLLAAISTQSVQTMRYLDANVFNPKDAERRERYRDLGVYRELMGEEPKSTSDRPNLVGNRAMRQFKRTSDVGEASELLPGLIDKAVANAGDDINKLKKELLKIKLNSYQTMPSPHEMPREFAEYYEYVVKTQGEDAATKLVTDYIEQNRINKFKTDLIPSF